MSVHSDSNQAYIDSLWSDDAYLSEIEKYKDKSWYNRLLDNPWLVSKQASYEPDFLTGLFNWKGGAASYYGGMRSNAMDWLAKMVNTLNEQDYNSAVEQVNRDNAAGINADLVGNVTPGDASENDEIAGQPLINGTSEYASHIADVGMKFFSLFMNFGTQIQQFGLNSARMVSDELAANDASFDFVVKQIAGLTPFKGLTTKEDLDSVDIPAAVSSADFGLKRFSSRTRKFMKNWLDALSNGDNLATEAVKSELYKTIVTNRKESSDVVSSPWWDDDFATYVDNVLTHLSKFTAIHDEYAARAQAGVAQVEGDAWFVDDENSRTPLQSTYGETLSMEMSARKSSADSVANQQEYNEKMEQTWKNMMDSVSPSQGEKTKWYHIIGKLGIMWLRAQVMQPLHFGFSQSTSDSISKTGTSHSSSRGFHM